MELVVVDRIWRRCISHHTSQDNQGVWRRERTSAARYGILPYTRGCLSGEREGEENKEVSIAVVQCIDAVKVAVSARALYVYTQLCRN